MKSASWIQSTAGHVKPGGKTGGPPSKPKYYPVTDSEEYCDCLLYTSNVDIILQSIGRDGTKDITFTVPDDKGKEAVTALQEYADMVGAKNLSYTTDVAKISVVGAGMETHEGVAAMMFEALADANINIQMISTSEIKVSVLIAAEDADRAVSAVHRAFFEM